MNSNLQVGEKVVMHTCYEAAKYDGRIWPVRSNPWILGVSEVVLLEGFSGGFATEYLQRVNLDDDTERCDTCGKSLDKSKAEDFFVEDESGSHVYCEEHWPGRVIDGENAAE